MQLLRQHDFDEAVKEKGLILVDQTYDTQRVQHCHIELPVSFAYQDGNGKITVTTSTQIPHIVRRVIGQALGIPWGQVRVIKPYIGGGFGNKQDVLYEPLNAFLSLQVGGRPVKLELTREETFADTRVRHAIRFHMQGAVRPDGTLVASSFIGMKRPLNRKATRFTPVQWPAAPCVVTVFHREILQQSV